MDGVVERLVQLDHAVDAAEDQGITARWVFGRDLLMRRVGKKLPAGLLDQLAEETGKSRTELQYRMQFAERFGTEEALSNAIGQYGSWYAIVNKAFAREKQPPAETPPLPDGRFATIVADPPWDVKTPPSEFGGSGQAQALEYPTMSVDEIAALPIGARVTDAAHLYLWTINAYVEDAYEIARAWGFKPSTLLVWCKPPRGLGQGGAYALTTEYVLFARRGVLPHQARVDTTWFEWPRRGHSVKPDEFFEVVEGVSPGPYLELFSRRTRDGWTAWGSEVADAIAA